MIQAFEAEATHSAAVWSLPCVGALVNLQYVCPCEALITHGAPMGFFLRMNSPVQLQIPEAAELVPAYGAAVRFVTCLATFVCL